MPTSADWGWSWTIAAYAVSWAGFLGYASYVSARSRAAHEALVRESSRVATAASGIDTPASLPEAARGVEVGR